jgi:hypothetical protein
MSNDTITDSAYTIKAVFANFILSRIKRNAPETGRFFHSSEQYCTNDQLLLRESGY